MGAAIEGTRGRDLSRGCRGDHLIVSKQRLSAFYPTDLDFLFRNHADREIVLNGGFTDCCMLNGAFDASNLGYRVLVARDLVRGTNPEKERSLP